MQFALLVLLKPRFVTGRNGAVLQLEEVRMLRAPMIVIEEIHVCFRILVGYHGDYS